MVLVSRNRERKRSKVKETGWSGGLLSGASQKPVWPELSEVQKSEPGQTLKRRLPVAGETRSAGEDEATGGGASLDSPEKVSRPPDTWIGNPSLSVQTVERSCEMRPGFRGPEESLTACTSL